MDNYSDANSQQYILERDPTKTKTKFHPSIGFSRLSYDCHSSRKTVPVSSMKIFNVESTCYKNIMAYCRKRPRIHQHFEHKIYSLFVIMIIFPSPITFHYSIYCGTLQLRTIKVVSIIIGLSLSLTHVLHFHQLIGVLWTDGNIEHQFRITRYGEQDQHLQSFFSRRRPNKLND